MRTLYLLLLINCWFVPVALGQTGGSVPLISINVKDKSLRYILTALEKQSGFFFSYETNLLDDLPPVSFEAHKEPFAYCLKRLFHKLPLTYRVTGQYVILKYKPRVYTISGFVRDSASYENLINASVLEKRSGEGTMTNSYGFYSLNLSPGEVTLRVSYVGYEMKEFSFRLERDTLLDLPLGRKGILQEVVVTGFNPSSALLSGRPGGTDVSINRIKQTPALLGEADLIKTIQQLPGVTAGMEGMSGLYVRGGNADENLFLLDGNPIYHMNHMLGFFSAFNPDAIKKVSFYKGSFPAEYGGRLSSVIDVRMNDGDRQEYHGHLSVGLLSARANLEGPIIRGRSSFHVSVRRTWLDLITWGILSAQNKYSDSKTVGGYHFFDINTKVNHSFSDRSRMYLSFYMGQDSYHEGEQSRVQEDLRDLRWRWGNLIGSAGWTYVFSNGVFGNFIAGYSRYRSRILTEDVQAHFLRDKPVKRIQTIKGNYSSAMEDISLRASFDYRPESAHAFKFGSEYRLHIFRPENNRLRTLYMDSLVSQQTHTVFSRSEVPGHELSLFGEDEMSLSDRLILITGLRYTFFHVEGQTYHSFQPRISARYLLNKQLSVKAAYSKMNQYIHLLSNSNVSQPTDIWVPVTRNIRPMFANQFEAGLYFQPTTGYTFSVEGYYKYRRNLIDYKGNIPVSPAFTEWENRVALGKGYDYGLELFAEKTTGRTTGSASYTLFWSEREFPDGSVNAGKRYPSQFDNRHKINLMFSHKLSSKVEFTAGWTYSGGNKITIPDQLHLIVPNEDANLSYPVTWQQVVGVGHEKNNYRLPAFHKLDVGINFYRPKRKGRMGIWNVSIYNVYNRMNVFNATTYLGSDYNSEGTPVYVIRIEKNTLFPIIPSVSYTYKF